LGSGRTVDVVTALSVARVFVPRDAWEKNLWRHSIQVAVTASDLAERAPGQDPSPEEAYCAGLLHDIGRFIMFHEAPDTLRQVDEGDWDSPSTLVDAERAICGLSHAELGAAACTKWGLPASITKVVLHHHQRPQRGATTNRLLALVQFADLAMFPSSQPNARSWAAAGESEVRRSLVPKLPPFIGLRPGDLLPLLLHSEAKADATARLLGV
jgi:putative nucleotidyltransferase with HDIG domain